MSRINNTGKYIRVLPEAGDIVIGSKMDDFGKTRNFDVADIVSLVYSISPNMLLNIAPLELVGNTLYVRNTDENMSHWRINNVSYLDSEERSFIILPTAEGRFRVDLLVVTTDPDNPFQYIQGVENEDSYLEPLTPPNTLRVIPIYVHNLDIQDLENPAIGENTEDLVKIVSQYPEFSVVTNDTQRKFNEVAYNRILETRNDFDNLLSNLSNVAYTGSYTSLLNIPLFFPPEHHTHEIADVIGLQAALNTKQATLVSGTNIKTINGKNVLGSGNLFTAPVLIFDNNARSYTGSTSYNVGSYTIPANTIPANCLLEVTCRFFKKGTAAGYTIAFVSSNVPQSRLINNVNTGLDTNTYTEIIRNCSIGGGKIRTFDTSGSTYHTFTSNNAVYGNVDFDVTVPHTFTLSIVTANAADTIIFDYVLVKIMNN